MLSVRAIFLILKRWLQLNVYTYELGMLRSNKYQAKIFLKSRFLGGGSGINYLAKYLKLLRLIEISEVKLATSVGSSKQQESSRKISTSALLTMLKSLTVWTTTNSGKFFKRWEYQTTWSASWEICMQIRKQQLELDMEQQTGSK